MFVFVEWVHYWTCVDIFASSGVFAVDKCPPNSYCEIVCLNKTASNSYRPKDIVLTC